MPTETLTELQYSTDRTGPWRLYVYESDGYHRGGKWFRKPPLRYPAEELTVKEAMDRVVYALKHGLEIRVCDGGGLLVFHAHNRKVIYGETFWNDILEEPRVV